MKDGAHRKSGAPHLFNGVAWGLGCLIVIRKPEKDRRSPFDFTGLILRVGILCYPQDCRNLGLTQASFLPQSADRLKNHINHLQDSLTYLNKRY